jgi:hypothetical protein
MSLTKIFFRKNVYCPFQEGLLSEKDKQILKFKQRSIQYQQKIRLLRQSNNRKSKRLTNMLEIVKDLKRMSFISPEQGERLSDLAGNIPGKFPLVFRGIVFK